MKQRIISFLYRSNVRIAMQLAAHTLIGVVMFVLLYLFIIFYWAAFYPV